MTTTAIIVVTTKLTSSNKIGMARSRYIYKTLIITRLRIVIIEHNGERCSSGMAAKYPRNKLRLIYFCARGSSISTCPTTRNIGRKSIGVKNDSWPNAINHHAQLASMRLAEYTDFEIITKCIHSSF